MKNDYITNNTNTNITINMLTPEDFATTDIFPYYESQQYEFKSNLCPGDKLVPTICAFLNSGGGYIICGIEDTTLKIKGIDKTSKHIDTFLLNIDTIFHMRKIITQSGNTICPSSVTTRVVKQKDDKPIIIITLKPGANIKYQLIDGGIYYRINASNYKISTSRMYTEAEVNSKIIRVRGSMMKETNRVMDLLQKRNKHLEEQVAKMTRDTTRTDLERMLFTKILNDKEEVDMKIQNTIKVSFCCGIIDFLFN